MFPNKNNVRALLLVVIYCFAVMTAGTSYTFGNHYEKGPKDSNISKVSLAVSSQNLPSSGFSQLKPIFPAPLLKLEFYFTKFTSEIQETIGAALYKQYTFFTLCKTFRLEVSDIIFPFHYFW